MQTISLDSIPKKLRKIIKNSRWLNYSKFSLHPNLFLVLRKTGDTYIASVFDIWTFQYYNAEAYNSYNEAVKSFLQKRDHFSRANVIFDEPVEVV